jgi:hypothetical protein
MGAALLRFAPLMGLFDEVFREVSDSSKPDHLLNGM